MKKTKTWLLVAALAILPASALIAGCGESDAGSSASAKPAGNPTDRAFVAQMVPHHRSAVDMAAIARTDATSPFVKNLAADITRSQTAEIAQMRRVDARLAAAGVKQGDLALDDHMMGMGMSASSLAGAKPFDAKFIAMMVPHHEGAVAMARVELAKGSNAELQTLAQSIISAQQDEVRQMRAHAKGSGATDTGAGHHSG